MAANKYEGYFSYYISRASDHALLDILYDQELSLLNFFQAIDSDLYDYAYGDGKWTVKEVIFHIIETEIIMLYRAIRFSRGDKTPLPGYDENIMIDEANVSDMSYDALLAFYKNTRSNTLFYFNHFTKEQLNRTGTFSDNQLDVQGLGYLIAGHAIHHIEIIKERYLIQQ